MEKQDVEAVDLERLAARMAAALPQLDCPQCCGPVYSFIESGALIYHEEWEWACVATVLVRLRPGPCGADGGG